jgi:DNA-binding transcriptional LysR family regulator
MLDPITLDQLRMLVAVVEEGSFSAAARKLHRVQSAVSTAMANLEEQLAVAIWDRRPRVAALTDQGKAIVAAARRVLGEVDALRRLGSGLASGIEPMVSLCVDAFFPLPILVALCKDFAAAFPAVDLRIDVQTLRAVSARVLDGSATLGVASPLGVAPGLERISLAAIRMVPVVAAGHPLARGRGRVSAAALAEVVQIVLSDRSDAGVPDQAVLSPRTWRVADLETKRALLRAGLGWGNLPEHVVREDLRRGKLAVLRPAAWGEAEHTLYLSAIHRPQVTFGPAHRWMLEQLALRCAADAGAGRARRPARR